MAWCPSPGTVLVLEQCGLQLGGGGTTKKSTSDERSVILTDHYSIITPTELAVIRYFTYCRFKLEFLACGSVR